MAHKIYVTLILLALFVLPWFLVSCEGYSPSKAFREGYEEGMSEGYDIGMREGYLSAVDSIYEFGQKDTIIFIREK